MAKRYQKGNQTPSIKEVQTIQWAKNNKKVIRSCKSKKYRQYNGQKIPKRESEAVNQRSTENTMGTGYQNGNQKP